MSILLEKIEGKRSLVHYSEMFVIAGVRYGYIEIPLYNTMIILPGLHNDPTVYNLVIIYIKTLLRDL